jgi:hypothetical protein
VFGVWPTQPSQWHFLTGTDEKVLRPVGQKLKSYGELAMILSADVTSLGLCPREVGTYWHFVGDDSSLCWTLQEVWCPIPQSQNAIESALSVWWQQTSPHISKWPYGMGAALEFLRPQLSIWKMGQIGSWELGGPLEWPQELPGAGRRSSECLCPAQTKALLKFIQSITDLQNKLFREKSVAKKSVKTIALD